MRQAHAYSSDDSASDPGDSGQSGGDVWRGILTGLLPLLLLIVVVSLAAAGAALARTLATPSGFLTWEWYELGVWGGGALLAIVLYIVATARALRLSASWRRAGLVRRATSAYWTLGVAAVVVLTPVILALALPQHPAP